jgi:hypothetical protein
MAEEVNEVVCQCVEGDKYQPKAVGAWSVKAEEISLTGTVESGLVRFTADQKTTLRTKNEFEVTVNAGGYAQSAVKVPGSILDRPTKLPIDVKLKRLTGKQKILFLKESRILESKISKFLEKFSKRGK